MMRSARRGHRRGGPNFVGVMAASLSFLAAPSAPAQDPPHWWRLGFQVDCTSSCHVPHQAIGSGITQSATNVGLCQSCHFSGGDAGDMPIDNADKANRNQRTGTSHAFDVPYTNVELDTQLPNSTEMQLRIMSNKVVCSTCHNQHKGELPFGGTPRVRSTMQITALGSTGSVTSSGNYTGAEGRWYLVEITTAGPLGTARFRYSIDNGQSWVLTNVVTAATVNLIDGVTISFAAGNYNLGEQWELGAAWPFLRTTLDSGNNSSINKYCRDCHRSWVMTHSEVENYDGNYKSHPVGVGLNANNKNYDRTVPLDGNGADQGSGGADTNPTNDLQFDASNNVQCLTCHNVHFADSNTESVDFQ